MDCNNNQSIGKNMGYCFGHIVIYQGAQYPILDLGPAEKHNCGEYGLAIKLEIEDKYRWVHSSEVSPWLPKSPR